MSGTSEDLRDNILAEHVYVRDRDDDFSPVLESQDYRSSTHPELLDRFIEEGAGIEGLEDMGLEAADLRGIARMPEEALPERMTDLKRSLLRGIHQRAKKEWWELQRESREETPGEYPSYTVEKNGTEYHVHPVPTPSRGEERSDRFRGFLHSEADRMLEEGQVYVGKDLTGEFSPRHRGNENFRVLDEPETGPEESSLFSTAEKKAFMENREEFEEVLEEVASNEAHRDPEDLEDLRNLKRAMRLPVHLEEEFLETRWRDYNTVVNGRRRQMTEQVVGETYEEGVREVHVFVDESDAPGLSDFIARSQVEEEFWEPVIYHGMQFRGQPIVSLTDDSTDPEYYLREQVENGAMELEEDFLGPENDLRAFPETRVGGDPVVSFGDGSPVKYAQFDSGYGGRGTAEMEATEDRDGSIYSGIIVGVNPLVSPEADEAPLLYAEHSINFGGIDEGVEEMFGSGDLN
ncbi:MAG: hypothetical protein ABEK01_01140 [Candidatus Nanohaloarchaea archaeon]